MFDSVFNDIGRPEYHDEVIPFMDVYFLALQDITYHHKHMSNRSERCWAELFYDCADTHVEKLDLAEKNSDGPIESFWRAFLVGSSC